MKTTVHRASTRGHANYGWLDTHHTFSFSRYYNPERMNFGVLRVLNDDIVEGGGGFGAHPHDNMEIVSIPLTGTLSHEDSMGNEHPIRKGEVQIMSAGSGLMHSEYNHSETEKVNFLQIWVLPKERNIKPRYDQKAFPPEERKNSVRTVVSPEKSEDTLWINQDAWFSLAGAAKGTSLDYSVKKAGNGVYIFVIEGRISVGGETLERRDGMGVEDESQIVITAEEDSEILLIEVPML